MTKSTSMPRYICHKVVHALKIVEIKAFNSVTDRLYPEDKRFGPFEVSVQWVREKKAFAPGYYVQYEDGYTSWSPVEAFEKGYTLDTGLPDPLKVEVEANRNLLKRIDTLVEDNNAVRHERDVLKARVRSLTTALTNISKTMQACIALADSELVNSEPTGFKHWPDRASPQPQMEELSYYEGPPVTMIDPGFVEESCSDQNVFDPFGAISTPDNRERVRAMVGIRFGSESPWRIAVRDLVALAKYGLESPTAEARLVIERAEQLLKDGVALGTR